jgi:predicted nucleotidyltransferase
MTIKEVTLDQPAQAKIIPISLEALRDYRLVIVNLAAQYGAYNVRVFGSVARGEADLDSDVDFLVDLEMGRSLFDLGGLLMDLQELLGCRVDVVTEKGLRQRIRDRVLREAVAL